MGTSACSWRQFTRQKPRRLARSRLQISLRHGGQRARPHESARLLAVKSASLLERPWTLLPRQESDGVLHMYPLYICSNNTAESYHSRLFWHHGTPRMHLASSSFPRVLDV